jgi:hypothetical protein
VLFFFLSAVTPFDLQRRSNLRLIWDCITDLFDVLGRTALYDEADGYANNNIDFSIKFLTGGWNLLELLQITISLSLFQEG